MTTGTRTRPPLPFLLAVLALLAVGCGGQDRLVVGSKPFAEARILGEMIAVLAEQEGIPVQRHLPYGNSFDCQQAIKQGDLDVYVEYNGTGMSMMGMPAVQNGDDAQQKVRELFEPLGLTWSERLGFDNGYTVVMRPDRAAAHGIETISDLVKLGRPVRIACTREYIARPVDGLTPLLQRHGLNMEGKPDDDLDRDAVYRAVLDGRVDVAIGSATDGQISEFAMTELTDHLGFYPAYEAAPLVRSDALSRFPELEDVLDKLAGLLDAETMRTLNKQVEFDGASPADVAQTFLAERGLLEGDPVHRVAHELVMVVPPGTVDTRLTSQAVRAIRKANPNRHVELVESAAIREPLLAGEAYIGIAGAERFFSLSEPRKLPERVDDIEAVAVLGYRMAHLLVPKDAGDLAADASPFAGIATLGIGPAGGPSERAATMLLDAWGLGGESVALVHGSADEQIVALRSGELDGVLTMAELGDPRIANALRPVDDRPLALRSFVGWSDTDRQFRFAFLRSTLIAAGTYVGLDESIETVGSQVVFVGPTPPPVVFGDGGPVGATTERQAIPHLMKRNLREFSGTRESIDPTLPGQTVGLTSQVRRTQPINPAPGVSFLTFVFLALFAWLVVVMFRRDNQAV